MVSRDGGASRDGGPSRPCRWACPHLHMQPGKDVVTGTRSRESRDTQKPTERLWHSCASMRERKPTRHLLWRRSEAGGGPEVSGLLPGTGAAPRGFALRGASRGGEGSEQPVPGAGGRGQVHAPSSRRDKRHTAIVARAAGAHCAVSQDRHRTHGDISETQSWRSWRVASPVTADPSRLERRPDPRGRLVAPAP